MKERKQPPSLTEDEAKAISALKRLARRWPKTLTLFSWSGSLYVMKPSPERTYEEAIVVNINGIPNEGGDPQYDDPSV
jgi:hypothetical protein